MKAAFEPRARIKEGVAVSNYASACTDISDGLAFSLHEVARASGVGFRVYEEKLPVDRELGRMAGLAGVGMDELIFHTGGEYELLFTLPEEHLAVVEKEMKALKTKLSVIGEIVNVGGRLVRKDGTVENLEPRGYEAFKSNF
jgi:thiamine-monophosphate kinase